MTKQWTPNITKQDEPLYLAITRTLAEDIASGALAPETRLPTHRELADELGVAIGTITRAYNEAERRGLIHGQGRRGTFVGPVRERGQSSLSTLFNTVHQVNDLSRHHPTYEADPDISAVLRRFAKRADIQQMLEYPPESGFAHHRSAAAKWLAAFGMETDPDSIILTAGAQHALLVIFSAVARPGEVVVTEAHTYPGIMAIADLLGLQLVGLPADDDGLTPEAFDTACRQRKVRALYCNPTLQNPTNVIVSEARRREIAAIAERHDVIIIEDEVLRRFVPDPPPLISTFAPDRSYLVDSASKVVAAGLRVGFIVAPAESQSILIDSLRATMLSVPPLPAEIMAFWIEDGTAEKTVLKRRQELAARQQIVGDILRGQNLRAQPTASYLWLHLPETWTTTEFTVEAHRRGVAIAPAEIFAVDKKAAANAIRISIGTAPNREALKSGLETIRAILECAPRYNAATI